MSDRQGLFKVNKNYKETRRNTTKKKEKIKPISDSPKRFKKNYNEDESVILKNINKKSKTYPKSIYYNKKSKTI